MFETGEKKKSYITVSENAIYSVVNNNPKVYDENGEVKVEEPKPEKEEIASEEVKTTKTKKDEK